MELYCDHPITTPLILPENEDTGLVATQEEIDVHEEAIFGMVEDDVDDTQLEKEHSVVEEETRVAQV